ncbi:hypothetical protein DEU47_11318 [Bacillus sp. AG236]|nr:hypothetical protein DEU47_11318 [Bacillus sp. AG236]
MDGMRAKMQSRSIEKALQGLSGVPFEEHARFILTIIDSRFVFTPLHLDRGIDGYRRIRVNPKTSTTIIEGYSIYGKEASTSKNSDTVKAKIRKDLKKAIEFAKEHEWKFKKWNLVINFELDTEFRIKLESLCAEQEMLFEEINPTVLVTKIRGESKIFEVACYCDAVDAPKLPYSAYSNHELARQALIDISQSIKSSTDEKKDLLREIITTILKIAFVDRKNPLIKFYKYDKKVPIAKNTQIHQDDIYDYKFVDGSFLPANKLIKEDWENSNSIYFFKDKNENFIVHVPNLAPIFWICNDLGHQLYQTGTFNLSEALKRGYNQSSFLEKIFLSRKVN